MGINSIHFICIVLVAWVGHLGGIVMGYYIRKGQENKLT
jgi:membrane associated rhomboid family serine protease